MTALAGVGSKLEAMQTRFEKNETATTSMAEDLKSAVESLRAAEAAAAIAALPPTLDAVVPVEAGSGSGPGGDGARVGALTGCSGSGSA